MTTGWTVPPPNSRVCDLCGHVGIDVAPALLRTAGLYQAVDRCKARDECQKRIDEQKRKEDQPWPAQ